MTYRLNGSGSRIEQVIDHFGLRVAEEHSTTRVDVYVDESDADDVGEFAEAVGVEWEELDDDEEED